MAGDKFHKNEVSLALRIYIQLTVMIILLHHLPDMIRLRIP